MYQTVNEIRLLRLDFQSCGCMPADNDSYYTIIENSMSPEEQLDVTGSSHLDP